MFRTTDRQKTLGSLELLLSPRKIDRLERKHWAGRFRRKALPILIEAERTFAPLFCPDNGRPNKPVAATVGLLILKEMFDLTDEAALDQFEFNAAYQYALDVEPDDAHVCQKTLHNFRARMSEAEEQGTLTYSALFDRIVQAIVEDLGLRTDRQRLDSTHIRSNMAVLTRLQLFTHQITAFLRKLSKQHPRLAAKLPGGLRSRYLDREGYFADAPSSKSRRRLQQCAADLWRLVDRFKGHRSVSGMPSYLRLKRLLEEQCVVEEDAPTDPDGDGPDGVPVRPKEPKTERIPADSLQGSDEDATYGHKGKGYQAQVAETCHADNPTQVVTHVSIEGAHASDQHATIEVIEALSDAGCKPETLLADTNYGRGRNIVEAADHGVDLLSPACGPQARGEGDGMRLEDFEFSADGRCLERCPAGHEPIEQGVVGGEAIVDGEGPQEGNPCEEDDGADAGGAGVSDHRRRFARISIEHCAGCDRAECCLAKWREGDDFVTIRWRPAAGATAARRRRERTASFKEAYRVRSGVEATNSEYKRGYGGGRLRVRGRATVKRVVRFKFMALNIARWLKAGSRAGAAARKAARQAA